MPGALDSAWVTLLEGRRYNASKNKLLVEDKWNGQGGHNSINEECLSGKLTAIARSSELKLRCLQNELAEAGSSTGAVDGGLYAYGPPVWESYKSLTKVPKIFKTLHHNDMNEDWSPNACFEGSHRSAADLVTTTSAGECQQLYEESYDFEKRDGTNCTFCVFCTTPEEHWKHFRHKHRSLINSAEVSLAAQRAASARSIYNRWSRRNASTAKPPTTQQPETKQNFGARYKVCVRTGKTGTSMKARIKLFGPEDQSDFIELRRGPSWKPFTFFSETTQIFFLHCEEVGEIKKCRLQIEGVPDQQWLLEEIVVVDLRQQKAWSFDGNFKLAMTKGYKMLTYEITPKERRTTQAFEIAVTTGNVSMAGTDANVFVTLFGKQGVSERLALRHGSRSNAFERGQTDVFTMKTKDVGDLTRIRIEHDNRGAAPGWFLEKVEIKELDHESTREWLFPCNQWLATSEGDGQIWRELHARPQSSRIPRTRPATRSTLQAYDVVVMTGNISMAGTDANVYITLFGKYGSTEKVPLRKPKAGRDPFETGQTDLFTIETSDVGDLTRIRIEHDNRGMAPGWFLDKVEVKELNADGTRSWLFPCNQWLAKNEGDGQIYKDLLAVPQETPRRSSPAPSAQIQRSKPTRPIPKSYDIVVTTGNVSMAGTDANVFITLYGDHGSSEKLLLRETNVTGRDPFETGQTDVFTVKAIDIGDLSRIRIEHDNKGMAPGWFLEKVEVKELNADGIRSWLFPCNQWLATNEGDGRISRELTARPQPRNTVVGLPSRRSRKHVADRSLLSIYEVLIETGASSFSGQNVNVFVQVFGNQGRSNEIWFSVGETGRFEKGCRDNICLETTNVGSLREIRIGHDHIGYGSGWLLENVVVKKYFTPKEIRDFRRVVRRRLEMADKPSYEYNDADASLFDDDDEAAKGFRDPEEYFEFKEKRFQMASKRVPVYEEYRFQCGQWLAIDDEGSGSKTEVTLRPTSSVIMFQDMTEEALREEKQSSGREVQPPTPRRKPSPRRSHKNVKRNQPSGLEESKVERSRGEINLVAWEEIKIVERPRSSSRPRPEPDTTRPRPRSSLTRKSVEAAEAVDLPPRPRRPMAAKTSRGQRVTVSRRATLYSDEGDTDDAEIEEHFGMSSSSASRDGRPFSASSATPPYIHVKCRNSVYSVYKGKEIVRFPVPDDKVPWSVDFKNYNPMDWTSPDMMGSWVDPDIRVERDQKLKFNYNDGRVNRQSHMGEYRITDRREPRGGVPLNPMGRTGMKGRGRLGRWGPNHAGDPIVTRWKRNERNIIQLNPRSGKPILQFVAIRRKDTGDWAIPGGMVDAAEHVGSTLKREFTEEALASLGSLDERRKASVSKLVDQFFQPNNGREIYRGYVDDPRNTDNAWMETVVVVFHDESGTAVGKLPLQAGDDAGAVRWADIGEEIKLYASHTSFIQRVARLLDAHW